MSSMPPNDLSRVVNSSLPTAAPATGPVLNIQAINDLIARLRRSFSPTRAWNTGSFNIQSAGKAIPLVNANPLRIGLGVQLTAGMTAFIGSNNAIQTADNQAGQAGYQLPVGGGWVFGAECPTSPIFIVAIGIGRGTYIELIGDVAVPPPLSGG